MNNNLLKIINPLLGISLLTQILTIALPKLGIYSSLIHEIHEYNGFLFFALALTHVYLNRWWFKKPKK